MCPEPLRERLAELRREWEDFKRQPEYLSLDRRRRPNRDWLRKRRNELLGFLRQALCEGTADEVREQFRQDICVWAFDFVAHATAGEVFRETAGLTEEDPYACRPGDSPRPAETTVELLEDTPVRYLSGPKKGEKRKLKEGHRVALIFDAALPPNTVRTSAYRLNAGLTVELALYVAESIVTAVRNNPNWAPDGLNTYGYLIPKVRDAMHHFKLWARGDKNLRKLKEEMSLLDAEIAKIDPRFDQAYRQGATREQADDLRQRRATLQNEYARKLYEYEDRLRRLGRNQPLPLTDAGKATPRNVVMRQVPEQTLAAEGWSAENLTVEQKLKQWREPAPGLDLLRAEFHEFLRTTLPGGEGERLCNVDEVLVRCGFHVPKVIELVSQELGKRCDANVVTNDMETIYLLYQEFLRKKGITQKPI